MENPSSLGARYEIDARSGFTRLSTDAARGLDYEAALSRERHIASGASYCDLASFARRVARRRWAMP
jgi:hypothetical protein